MLLQLTSQMLEEATGGIVIWQSGSRVLLYRDDEGRKAREAERQKRLQLPNIDDISLEDSTASEDE